MPPVVPLSVAPVSALPVSTSHHRPPEGDSSDRSDSPVSAPVQIPSESTLAALRSALRNYLAGRRTGGELHRALQALCAEAHGGGLRAEELLVRLKQLFYQLPEVQALPHGTDRNDLLNRVVSVCIEEYYGETR